MIVFQALAAKKLNKFCGDTAAIFILKASESDTARTLSEKKYRLSN